jgi:hypothetical protein
LRTLAVCFLFVAAPALAAEPAPLLAKIKSVGREGAGNAEASKAWQELVKLGPAALFDTLAALDDADPTAANWLRSAVDAIADHELAAKRALPTDKLEAFIKDTKHSGRSRRLAYEWLVRVDPSTPKRLLPGMLNDPGSELRRDAVAVALDDAQKLSDKDDKAAAKSAYEKVLAAARDKDQVDLAAKQLKTLGVTVDLPAHFGFIQRWQLVAPFDNRGGKGFAVVYPPENGVDLHTTYAAKEDSKVGWKEFTTTDAYGVVDLNKVIGKHMGAVGYAFAAVESPKEQAVEIRAGSNNAVKLFLNGKNVFFREEYHHGNHMDQHVGRGVLKAGRNEVLIKVCQNEQKDDWAQSWSFQLRICDAIGGAVPFKVVTEKSAPAEKKE